MASKRNGRANLVQWATGNVGGLNVSQSLKPLKLAYASAASTTGPRSAPSNKETSARSLSTKATLTGIKFGTVRSTVAATTKPTGAWSHLLTQTASGGIASVFTGALTSITGLGGLVSGLIGLFGGGSSKTTPPPFVPFHLASPASQTMYVGSKGSTVYQGSSVETQIAARANTAPAGSAHETGQLLQYQTGAIAQAVKTALLNSSSLNDVIGEL